MTGHGSHPDEAHLLPGEKLVLNSIQFWKNQHVALTAHLTLLPTVLAIGWFAKPTAVSAALWSAGAALYAGWVWLKGFTPWLMPLFQSYSGSRNGRKSFTPIQVAAYQIMHKSAIRRYLGAVTLSAAATPWAIYLVRSVAGLGSGIAVTLHESGLWLGFGFIDGIRASTLGTERAVKELEASWPRIRSEVDPQGSFSLGSVFRSSYGMVRISGKLVWRIAVGLAALALVAFAAGWVRRHGL